MEKQFSKYHQIWLLFCILIIVIDLGFRCYNIEKKVYWHDEVYTSMRVSGYNNPEVVRETFTGQVIQPKDLLKYQKITDKKTWKNTWDKLVEHP